MEVDKKKCVAVGWIAVLGNAMRQKYKIVLIDIDGSTFSDKVKAYSFEDALTRIRAKFKGYEIKSVELGE